MVSPDGIVPPEYMHPSQLGSVIYWLRFQPWPGYYKRAVLQGWGHAVGRQPSQQNYAAVEASGWKRVEGAI